MKLILITGSMGAGKSTTLAEASDLLTQADIPHAAIDLDALGLAHLPRSQAQNLTIRNLAAVAQVYAKAGIELMLIAAAVESAQELDAIVAATNAERAVVCRLRASLAVMQDRVAARERGIFADRYISRVHLLDGLLDRARLEDFHLDTTHAHVTEIARELLRRVGVGPA